MAERAQVTSVEAIQSFRGSLILYLSKARPALEEVSNEVLRTRTWLQNDQRRNWEHQFKIRSRKLEEAQQALFSAMVSQLQSVTAEQQRLVHQAKHAVEEVDNKLKSLKQWDRELENRSAPLLKQVEQLHGFLTSDMVKAVAYLAQVVKALDAYAGVALPGAATAPAEAPADAAQTEGPADGVKGGEPP